VKETYNMHVDFGILHGGFSGEEVWKSDKIPQKGKICSFSQEADIGLLGRVE
jgi:hypothetical protein